jgi:uncharacterized phage protein (predicted DNA packaging)
MFLYKIKLALRVDDTYLDEDIQDTINAAIEDLKLSGVSATKIVETDSLILRAVKVFCKAEFSSDDKEATRFRESYNLLKMHLALSSEYLDVIV